MTAILSRLTIHPVKSAAGIACERVVLGPRGLQHDREWMIVDAAGRFVTQREEARLALLEVAIDGGRLRLSSPQGEGPSLPLDHEGELCEVTVWRSQCAAFDAGGEAAQFLSGWLGRPLRLVRFDARRQRLSNHDWTGGRDVPNQFSDGYPLLVLSQASVDDLAARVGRSLPVERFRANLVIDGVAPYAEDQAASLVAGAARFTLTKACTRCVITTIDHQRGERDGEEPLRTLRTYRHDKGLRGVVFGRNAFAVEGVGTELWRGMPVSLPAA
ncbi:MAG: MOSC domain-containing protein [Pseudomonadota bacterium]|nr:MOSC domain-containing protein [Pseudomonadota bacterium]